MSQNEKAQDRNTEGMLYVHTLYYLFLNGPIKKDEFEEKIFKFLEDNKLFFPEDLEIIKSRETRSRPEKIYQQLRNLAKSNKSLAPSHFITETDTHFELDHAIFDMLSKLVKPSAISEGSSSRRTKIDKSLFNKFNPQNILLFGPPGTGKTRAAKIISVGLLTGAETNMAPNMLNSSNYPEEPSAEDGLNLFCTQFHPSYSYEDFFEGMRPIQILNDNRIEVTYSIVSGIFKVACQVARAYLQPKDYGIDLMVQFTVQPEGKSKWEIGDNSTVAHFKLAERTGYLEYNAQTVVYTGDAASSADLSKNFPEKSGYYQVKWFYSGENENKNFVLFIDELNRGNPAKIFGEALSLIEETKRLGGSETAEIMLPYSHEQFSVPPNLHIVCAMNSADKSLSSLDQAFRRRFKSIYLAPAFEIITTKEFKEKSKVFNDEILYSLRNHFVAVNNALRATRVPQECLIGHSFLLKLLRKSYSQILEQKLADKNDAASKNEIISIVRNKLREVWENELHSLVRDIVGENRLQEFCDNFATEVVKTKDNLLFLAIGKDTSDSLYKYLDNLRPDDQVFPWKSVG